MGLHDSQGTHFLDHVEMQSVIRFYQIESYVTRRVQREMVRILPFSARSAIISPSHRLRQYSGSSSTASSFHFNIETRPSEGPGLFSRAIGDPLPERLVTARQLLGEDGAPTPHLGGRGSLPSPIGGQGSGGGSNCRIKAIRFVIAVHPAQRRIPFEVQHVPLPDPDQPGNGPRTGE
jgi:hypothetical protein